MSARPHLPGILAEIADVAGVEAARTVARIKGGARAYFRLNPPDDHWLVQAVGREKADLICAAIGNSHAGVEYDVPMAVYWNRPQLWREIQKRLDAGQSKPEIARALGVHHKTVQAHKNGRRSTVQDAIQQIDLFDNEP